MTIRFRGMLILAVLGIVVMPGLASAQGIQLDTLNLPVIASGNLITVLERLLQQVLLIIGIIAFFYLLYAGFNYVTAGGDPAKTKASMSTIVNVVIGIIIIAVSYVLLTYVINQATAVGGRGGTTPTPSVKPTTSTAPRPRTRTT